ncbi:MAG: adenylate/guanylate cyclase domain-containing protein [Pseudomonadota bacterium]
MDLNGAQDPEAARPPAGADAAPLARLESFILGERPPARVSPRTQADIRRLQRSSEILVCWIQFAAIAFFGLVYAITPKAFPPSVPFEPVPAVLGLYAIVTALRLQLSRAGRLTGTLRVASAVIDVTVLMVTIWSFHLQYGVAPAVYLKAPTLLYAFILIALRTLRLEAGLVLATGAAAILGWAALFGYALAEAGAGAVTRDWAEAMTTARILIGAEVDKLLAIGAVTMVLAVAVERARRLMIRAAAERRATEDLSRFFAPGVAEAIRQADLDLARPGALREATVLMADLQGFSETAGRLSPEDTVALLSEYHGRVVPIIHRHGGDIDKYLGDGILATFGAVRRGEGHAARGMAALRELLAEGERWRRARAARGLPAPAVCAAIDSGEVTLGIVGEDGRYEFTIIGEVVNRVAKLDKHGRALGVRGVATAALFEAAGRPDAPGFELRPAPPPASGPAAGMALVTFDLPRQAGGALLTS